MDYKDALIWCEQFEENILLIAPERDKMVLALQAMKKCREVLEKQIEAEKPLNYSDYVEIECAGKKYVGRIKSVDSVWNEGGKLNGKAIYSIAFFNVCLIEKDTNCTISNIIIQHFSDIKTYKGE